MCPRPGQVGSRWGEFSDDEHAELAKLAFTMVTQGARRAAIRLHAARASRLHFSDWLRGGAQLSACRAVPVCPLLLASLVCVLSVPQTAEWNIETLRMVLRGTENMR